MSIKLVVVIAAVALVVADIAIYVLVRHNGGGVSLALNSVTLANMLVTCVALGFSVFNLWRMRR